MGPKLVMMVEKEVVTQLVLEVTQDSLVLEVVRQLKLFAQRMKLLIQALMEQVVRQQFKAKQQPHKTLV